MSALVLLLLAAPSDLALQVKARLDPAPVQQGRFEQRKQVKGFKRPLVSSGEYVVSRGEGVQWNTQKPFPSQLSVKAEEISSRQGPTELFRLDAKSEPTVRLITSLLFSLLSGDLGALESQFAAQGEVGPGGWSIELTPRAEGLKRVFTRIALKGDRSVRTVELDELSGDTTTISLTPESGAR